MSLPLHGSWRKLGGRTSLLREFCTTEAGDRVESTRGLRENWRGRKMGKSSGGCAAFRVFDYQGISRKFIVYLHMPCALYIQQVQTQI